MQVEIEKVIEKIKEEYYYWQKEYDQAKARNDRDDANIAAKKKSAYWDCLDIIRKHTTA